MSLSEGCFPDSFKKAIVAPLIKKSSLPPDELKNYRPVSGLCFVSDGRDDFLIKGVTTAFMKLLGKHPSDKNMLMSLVIGGKRTSTHSLSKKVGIGSRRQDFVGDSLINLRTLSSDYYICAMIYMYI